MFIQVQGLRNSRSLSPRARDAVFPFNSDIVSKATNTTPAKKPGRPTKNIRDSSPSTPDSAKGLRNGPDIDGGAFQNLRKLFFGYQE